MENIILIDAYSQIFRCYYAMKASLTNSRGEPVNALYGIARLLLLLEKTQPSGYGAICFDKGGSKRRKDLLPEYKSQRPPMPEALRAQIEPIKEWMAAFGWNLLENEGVEADDIIAAVTAVRDGRPVSIVTHDKDIAQLIDCPDIKLILSAAGGKWEETHAEDIVVKFGVGPDRLRDYLALVGDAVDNIHGVDGVGPKTAAALLMEHGSIENALAHLDCIKSQKLRTSLEANRELLKRNIELVSLDTELPPDWHGLEGIRRRTPDWAKLRDMALGQGFKTLLKPLEDGMKNASQLSFL